ncbi:PRC-barrel domain-containing protein [Pelagibacterium montanilacus]|uniref:PRC-barrel domain-containing protein n=1 Tax=Pelagibacterium montanilacus TaxID=2185280 RepID=UPI000F8CD1B7|nr:PRC-barrel domain-containing protein [Pelagibacterium montanilacus]
MDTNAEKGLGNAEVDRKETASLIGSDKVEGTKVYSMDGDHIGSIERVMLDKYSGQVAYAVLSFGGFFGIGDEHYPVPWAKLTYDEDLGGYRTDLSKEQVENAPRVHRNDDDRAFNEKTAGIGIYNYYGIPPYWI